VRDIKFRGKTINGKKWIYGSYALQDKYHMISIDRNDGITKMLMFHSVIPETVGQFTGLKDINDIDIYEGDMCSYQSLFKREKGTIVYKNGAFKLKIGDNWFAYLDKKQEYQDMGASSKWNLDLEVIGYITEKKEKNK